MSRFDQKLAAGEGVVGTFSHLGGPAVAECLSLSGLAPSLMRARGK